MIERDPNLACDWCEYGEVASRRQPCCDCWVASQLSKVIRFEIAADVASAVETRGPLIEAAEGYLDHDWMEGWYVVETKETTPCKSCFGEMLVLRNVDQIVVFCPRGCRP